MLPSIRLSDSHSAIFTPPKFVVLRTIVVKLTTLLGSSSCSKHLTLCLVSF